MRNCGEPAHISQKEWDDVDIPPLTDEQLAEMRPLRELDPQLAAWSAKRRRGNVVRRRPYQETGYTAGLS